VIQFLSEDLWHTQQWGEKILPFQNHHNSFIFERMLSKNTFNVNYQPIGQQMAWYLPWLNEAMQLRIDPEYSIKSFVFFSFLKYYDWQPWKINHYVGLNWNRTIFSNRFFKTKSFIRYIPPINRPKHINSTYVFLIHIHLQFKTKTKFTKKYKKQLANWNIQ